MRTFADLAWDQRRHALYGSAAPVPPSQRDTSEFDRMVAERAEFDRQKTLVRYHEGGHAAVAHALGVRVQGVSASRAVLGDHRDGSTLISYQPTTPAEVVALVGLAGPLAERRCDAWRPGDDDGSEGDEASVREALGGPPTLELRQRAARLVAEVWQDVEAVVALLADDRSGIVLGSDVTAELSRLATERARRSLPAFVAAAAGQARSERDLKGGLAAQGHRAQAARTSVSARRAAGTGAVEERVTAGPVTLS